MANSQELFEEMTALFTDFTESHNGTTKKSATQARKAIGEMKKLVTEYRKASIDEDKK